MSTINPIKNYTSVASLQETGKTKPSNVSAKQDMPSPVKDEVTLSELSKSLSVNSEIPFDSAKVARLKAQIDAGTYKIDSASIAQNLLDQAVSHIKK